MMKAALFLLLLSLSLILGCLGALEPQKPAPPAVGAGKVEDVEKPVELSLSREVRVASVCQNLTESALSTGYRCYMETWNGARGPRCYAYPITTWVSKQHCTALPQEVLVNERGEVVG